MELLYRVAKIMDLEVLEPPDLREAMRRAAGRLAALYRESP